MSGADPMCTRCAKRKAVFWVVEEKEARCGACSRKKERTELKAAKAEPSAKRTCSERKRAEVMKEALAAAEARGGARRGTVSVGGIIGFGKLGGTVDPKVLNIFPNFKHGSRTDGLGIPSLSPMSIGPIPTNQPAPYHMALNLENFHQGSKYFGDCQKLLSYIGQTADAIPECRCDRESPEDYFAVKQQMFLDSNPHRHKPGRRGTAPTCSVWQDDEGAVHFIDYIESRQFYCTYYERSLTGQYNDLGERHRQAAADYQYLLKLLNDSVDLMIWGYDGYPIEPTHAAIRAQYLDTTYPFGHEAVLFTMLTLPPPQWPWKEFTTKTF
eukprot:TRINITY_DN2716_c0_g1_i1.p1 TRINITY_DN2716_c0_g1~~TRINITY_DN2716_c0_g1_i1.p1  ORF type:complete len:326 (+),score=114.04 TRINITY_DN2716_c0_g1_i1:46-1023(+)